MNTKIDATLYREAQKQYKQWNEAELIEQVRNAGKTPPEKKLRQYFELVEFCRGLNPRQSEWQRAEKLAALDRYYDAVYKLEEWRKQHLVQSSE